MRRAPAWAAVATLMAATAVTLAGCGSKTTEPTGPPIAEIDNTINDGTFGATNTVDCADGKSLNVGGSGNTLTVTGRCSAVNIGGDDNNVRFETVDTALVVVGEGNTVTYRDGDPEVEDLGSGNTITKG